MKLLVINPAHERVPAKWLERWLKSLGRHLVRRGYKGLSKKELVVVFVTGREMRRLNRLYRGHDKVTDILSFESAEQDALGELVLSLGKIREQSRDTGLSPRGELGYMIVHGVLHLLGHDHDSKKKEREMFSLQDEIFAYLSRRVGLS